MKAIAQFLAALFQALFGALTYPLRLLGWQPRPTAAAVADAAVQAIREYPLPVVAPPAPREPTPMSDLVLAHARAKTFTHERHPELVPLPPAIQAWFEQLDDFAVLNIIGAEGPRLQRHINAGLAGSTARGPFNLPPVLPHAVPMQAKKGSTGGTSGPARSQDLNALMEELGMEFAPSYSPRPR